MIPPIIDDVQRVMWIIDGVVMLVGIVFALIDR